MDGQGLAAHPIITGLPPDPFRNMGYCPDNRPIGMVAEPDSSAIACGTHVAGASAAAVRLGHRVSPGPNRISPGDWLIYTKKNNLSSSIGYQS
jgi:hypothetical protein